MKLNIIRARDAIFDEIDIAYYFGERRSIDAPDQFMKAVWGAYSTIATMPRVGALRDYGNPKFAGMRMLPIPNFKKYLIFYQTTDMTVEILRVLHGARDLQAIFGPDDEDA